MHWEIILIIIIAAAVAAMAVNTEGFNMNMMTRWPQYSRTPRPTYDPETVIQETIPYLRSGQPFQYAQLVPRDARCANYGENNSCDRAMENIASQAQFADSSIGMPEQLFRAPHEVRMKRVESFSPAIRATVSKPRVDAIDELKTADRAITGSNSEIVNYTHGYQSIYSMDGAYTGPVNLADWNPLATYHDSCGRESTGLIFAPAMIVPDVANLPQNHPAILGERHRIGAQVNNWLGPLEKRRNLEKTLIADVLRYRAIPKSFGGA